MPALWAARSLLLAGIAALAAGPSVTAQTGEVNKVTYRDRATGKETTVDAETKESPAGVTLIVGGKATRTIAPGDVVRIDYASVPPVTRADQLVAMATEDGKEPAKAQAAYADLLKKAGANAPEKARRFLQYREATWAARVADGKTGDEFKADAGKVAEKMLAVARLAKKGWEVWPASKAAARLYEEVDDYGKAAEVLGELAGVPDLPGDLRVEARLAEAAALLRARQSLRAENTLEQVEKDKEAAAGAAKEKLAVLKAAAKVPLPKPGDPPADGSAKPADELAKLVEAVEGAKDAGARAVGYNFLGDGYAAAGQSRDAMWAYLWVDVVYNQDREEQVYAVRQLAGVFDKLNDKDRADQFREKLVRVR